VRHESQKGEAKASLPKSLGSIFTTQVSTWAVRHESQKGEAKASLPKSF